MSETQRAGMTSGPWRWVGSFNPSVEAEDQSDRICMMLDHKPRDYANAQAIAALPELVEALRETVVAIDMLGAVGNFPSDSGFWNSKAESTKTRNQKYQDKANVQLMKAYSAVKAALAKAGVGGAE